MSSNLPVKKNWGQAYNEENPNLIRALDEMYTDIANAINNLVKKNVVATGDPPANSQINSFFSVGDIWVRKDTNKAWIMTSRTTPNAVTWIIIT
jgi:hypothetical protein